jgi:Filamin/ABP280 repeat
LSHIFSHHYPSLFFSLTIIPFFAFCSLFRCFILFSPGKELLFQAGVPFSFTVIARDLYANKTRKGAERMEVTMQGSGPQATLLLVDNNDGTYGVTYSVELSGKYYVNVLVGQVPIHGCPFSVFINGGKHANS